MATWLEIELKRYATYLVGTKLKYEYDRQIDFMWKPHINLMVDAQTEARNRHQQVLNKVREQIQKEQEAGFGLAMLALSFVAGPALSWIAGKIQYHWVPKYASKTRLRAELMGRSMLRGGNVDIDWQSYYSFKDDHNKVHAKVFGTLGEQVLGLGIDKAVKVVAQPSRHAENAVKTAASSPAQVDSNGRMYSSFKTNLENALAAEAQITSDAIMSLSDSINDNNYYGAEVLARLRSEAKKGRPEFRRALDSNVTERELEEMAKNMIVEDIDNHREEWSDEWFYYGYDAGSTLGLAEEIERELWALWILNEQFKFKTKEVEELLDNAGYSWKRTVSWVEGATFGERGVPELVLQKLADFGVVEARTKLQKLRAITARGVKEKQDSDARARQKQYVPLVDPHQSAKGQQEPRARKEYVDAMKRWVDLHKEEPDRPQISVGHAVDTQAEIAALESWATHHPLILGSGQLTHVKRTLGSIRDIRTS